METLPRGECVLLGVVVGRAGVVCRAVGVVRRPAGVVRFPRGGEVGEAGVVRGPAGVVLGLAGVVLGRGGVVVARPDGVVLGRLLAVRDAVVLAAGEVCDTGRAVRGARAEPEVGEPGALRAGPAARPDRRCCLAGSLARPGAGTAAGSVPAACAGSP